MKIITTMTAALALAIVALFGAFALQGVETTEAQGKLCYHHNSGSIRWIAQADSCRSSTIPYDGELTFIDDPATGLSARANYERYRYGSAPFDHWRHRPQRTVGDAADQLSMCRSLHRARDFGGLWFGQCSAFTWRDFR